MSHSKQDFVSSLSMEDEGEADSVCNCNTVSFIHNCALFLIRVEAQLHVPERTIQLITDELELCTPLQWDHIHVN